MEKGVSPIGWRDSSLEENKYSIVIDQKAMNKAWKIEMIKGISNDEEQLRTKSEEALMIPMAFIDKKVTYLYLSFHATNNE